MGWKVLIGEGATQFTISASAKFDLEVRTTHNERGDADTVEHFVEIEGDLVSGTPAQVTQLLIDTRAEAGTKFTPRRVQLQLDGVTKFDFKPVDGVGSPRIQNVRTIDEEGNADSHWRYAMSIFAKQPGNLANEMLELQTSVLEVQKNDRVVRKVWRAGGKSKTVAMALTGILAFKPDNDQLLQEIEQFPEDNRVTAVWTWEAQQDEGPPGGPNDGIIEFLEDPVEIVGDAEDWVPDPQVSADGTPAQPKLHRRRVQEIIVTIRGRVRGFKRDQLAPPPAHLTPDENIRRARGREVLFDASLEDPTREIYVLPYQEIYVATNLTKEEVRARINHIGHGGGIVQPAPLNGPINANEIPQ